MMSRSSARVAVIGAALAAAVAGVPAPAHAGASSVAPTQRPPGSCGTRQEIWRAPGPPTTHARPAEGAPRTIYLNRNGGTFAVENQPSNAATNVINAQVTASSQIRTAVIPPLAADFDWKTIAACVTAQFVPYHVRIVESEPSTGPYLEAIVGGFGTELGFRPNELFGIAAADNFCGVTEQGIAFTFSEPHRNVPQRDAELCATIAHEIGHLLALEHEVLAPDLMSYVLVSETTPKSFVDQASACGVVPGQQQSCSCSSGQTNSHGRLSQYVGDRPIESVPPTLVLEAPGDGAASVPPVFDVVALATDDRAMADVRVLLDDVELAASATPDGDRYTLPLRDIAEGPHTLTVIARDQAGNATPIVRAITVAKLALGETCVANEACAGGLCALLDGDGFCTQTCDVTTASCPADYECTASGDTAVCVPTGGGCGCATADPRGGLAGLLVLGVGLVIARCRRRARR